MRAAVYTRISLDKTGEGAGVERQREDCTRLIGQREWQHVATFEDNSISAAGHRRRPGFDALLVAIGRGELDMVVSWAWDRLSRNRRDEVALIEACKAHGVSVSLVRGAGDLDMSSAVGRGIGEILATLGRMENEQKSERQRRALAQKASKGLPWGPIPAFGYAADRVTVIGHEADLIRGAYSSVLAGASCRGIAREWNEAGIVTRTDRPWSGAAVRRLLVNPRYMGVRGTSVGTGGRRELLEAGPAVWPAIVDEATWRSAHALVTDAGRRSTDVRVRRHLLPGIAVCGRCGAPVRSHTTQRGYTAYACSASRHLSRKAASVDELVSLLVIERLGRPDARDLLVDGDRPDAVELSTRALALRKRLETIAAEFGSDPDTTPAEYRAMRQPVRDDLAAVEAQMTTGSRAPVLADLVAADDVATAWGALGLDRRRAVISALLVPRLLPARRGPGFDPESVEIDWRT